MVVNDQIRLAIPIEGIPHPLRIGTIHHHDHIKRTIGFSDDLLTTRQILKLISPILQDHLDIFPSLLECEAQTKNRTRRIRVRPDMGDNQNSVTCCNFFLNLQIGFLRHSFPRYCFLQILRPLWCRTTVQPEFLQAGLQCGLLFQACRPNRNAVWASPAA